MTHLASSKSPPQYDAVPLDETVYSQETAVDFVMLANEFPLLKKYVKTQGGEGVVDFRNGRAVRMLAMAILWSQFRLRVEFPLDSLCPTIPSRLCYVRFIEDLLTHDKNELQTIPVIGVDIGCGASCIYPLLACSRHPGWTFVAYDLDSRSLSFASQNVVRNNLSHRIALHQNLSQLILPPAILDSGGNYSFIMTNPPFYSSRDDIQASSSFKSKAPSGKCFGTDNEMIASGGELSFLRQYLSESMQMKDRVQWFTTLVGKKADFSQFHMTLKSTPDLSNIKVASMHLGLTKRWLVAWSWHPLAKNT